MTLLAYPIIAGHVVAPTTIVTALVAGHRTRLHVTHVDGAVIEGVELRRRRMPGGRVLIDTDGRTWERGNVRTVTVDQIVTVHRAREVGAT